MEDGLLLTRELDANGVHNPSSKVDYHLNSLLASHLSNSDLSLDDIVEASRSNAEAAAIAAKEARANADVKAAAAAKAVAAAKTALDLIASLHNQAPFVAAADDDLMYSKDDDLPSKLQLEDASHCLIPNSSSTWEHINDHIGSGEKANSEHVVSKTVDFSSLGMDESVSGEGAKDGIQGTRKRGRPKSK